jgi:mRNA interferase MazF
MEINQYQIILVNHGDPTASEAKKSAQCIVISPDEINKFVNTVIVAPVISDSENYPTRIKIKFDNKISRVVLDQITTIEKQRIVKVLGVLSGPEIKKIKSVLKEIFVD